MTRRDLMVTTVRPVLVLVLVLVASCTKHDSLVLLELRSSGPLGAPVASIRLSASGWPTRTVAGSIGPEGFRVGYYGPGDGKALTVRAEALDAADCVLGIGSAGVTALAAGAISAPTTLFVRPQPGNGCADAGTGGIDAGETDAGESDAGESDAGESDAGESDAGGTDTGEADAGVDADDDAPADADADEDAPADAGMDADDDAPADADDEAGTD